MRLKIYALHKNLFLLHIIANNLKFYQSFRTLVLLVLLSVFPFTNTIFAQHAYQQQNFTPPTLVLKEGASLYSTEDHFNNQILSNKIILIRSEVSYQKLVGNQHMLGLMAKKARTGKKKFHKQKSGLANTRRHELASKELRIEIEKFKKRSQSLSACVFKNVPSTDHFFSSGTNSKNYAAPGQRNHDLSKFSRLYDANEINQPLDFLHFQKFRYYNNKSLDFCFSDTFFTRPPPTV